MFLHTPKRISPKKRQPLQLLALLAGAFALLAFAWKSPLIQHELQQLSGADAAKKSHTNACPAPIQAVQNEAQAVCLPVAQPEIRIFSQVSGCRAIASAPGILFPLPFGCRIFTATCGNLSATSAGRILDNPAQRPAFPGGNTAIQEFVNVNLHYPEEAARQGIEGKVYTQFVVEKDGVISQIRVLKGIDQELDEEAVRIVRAMPKWNAGEHKHRKVRCYVRMPIVFALAE